MPKPMKKGLNIHVEHIVKPAEYGMRSADIYTDCYGIGYIISGDREITTPNGIYFAHPGDVGVMGMGLYHRTAAYSAQPYERYGTKFTPKMVERLINTIGENRFQEFMSHMGYRLEAGTRTKVERIFQDMLSEYENYDDTSELLLEGMLNHLIMTIMKEGILPNTIDVKINVRDNTIMKVLAYLDMHYAENPSIEELSSIACLSRAQFMKRFKMAVGSSYKTYLNCYKVRLAQALLTNTESSVGEIAQQLGFCNANYFCNVFKEISGQSPLIFRKDQIAAAAIRQQ